MGRGARQWAPASGLIKGFFNAAKERKEVRNLRNDFIEVGGGIASLGRQAQAAGIDLDRLLAARKKGELEAAIKEITEAFEYQQAAMNLAIETAQRYGFTLEELGPAMARQELDKQAQQLYKDWEVLNAAGIDTVNITNRMSESVSEYVQEAMAIGSEVPNAMRPMLEAFAKSGRLLDANGDRDYRPGRRRPFVRDDDVGRLQGAD